MKNKIIIIVIIILILLYTNRENFWNWNSKVSTADGDKCIIHNGVMVCEDKGIYPSWFYPSYYNWYSHPYYHPYYYGHYFPRRRYHRRRKRWGPKGKKGKH